MHFPRKTTVFSLQFRPQKKRRSKPAEKTTPVSTTPPDDAHTYFLNFRITLPRELLPLTCIIAARIRLNCSIAGILLFFPIIFDG
jgi:hypothetical protein